MVQKVEVSVEGGERWKSALDAIRKRGRVLRVGIFEGATRFDGTKVAPYAFWNEYGTSRIPSRPFMRQTIARNVGAWGKGFAANLQGAVTSEAAIAGAFRLLGEQMAGDVVATIASSMDPPNAPETLRRKNPIGDAGRDRTLIDTGALISSISYELGGE